MLWLRLRRRWLHGVRLSVFRVALQKLLQGLIAQDKTETPPRGHINSPLQIQLAEINCVFDPIRAGFLDRREVQLVVDEPVVGHVEDRAVLQIELRQFAAPSANS